MASFELRGSICDGHIRIFARTITLASNISSDILIEFTATKMKLCARSDLSLVKFIFMRDFFANYSCDRRHRCYVHARALLGPAKSMMRLGGYENSSPHIRVNCIVEDELKNQITLSIGSAPLSTTLTYRIYINDLSRNQRSAMKVNNRTIEYWRVEISLKADTKYRFLATDLDECPTIMDQLTIRCSPSEIRYTASAGPLSQYYGARSEFIHKRSCYLTYNIREPLNITLPLRSLRRFVNHAETNKIQVSPTYTFEGFGMPAHFVYSNALFEAQFISSTSIDFIPDEFYLERICSSKMICYGGPGDELGPQFASELTGEDQEQVEVVKTETELGDTLLERFERELNEYQDQNEYQNELDYSDDVNGNKHCVPTTDNTNEIGPAQGIEQEEYERKVLPVTQSQKIASAIPNELNDISYVKEDRYDEESIELDYSSDSELCF